MRNASAKVSSIRVPAISKSTLRPQCPDCPVRPRPARRSCAGQAFEHRPNAGALEEPGRFHFICHAPPFGHGGRFRVVPQSCVADFRTASNSSSNDQTCPAIPAIMAAVGRRFPLLPGIRVCQQKL